MHTAAAGSTPRQVLALLDDAAAGDVTLELSSALAQALQRELAVVYIESVMSLSAAALPFTRVLSHADARWLPFSPDDVEQGFRAQATRLRSLAERIALRHRVGWSLRVVRGTTPAAVALSLRAQGDLLLLAGSPSVAPPATPAGRPTARRPLVTRVATDGEADSRALQIATELAHALGGRLETVRIDPLSPWARERGPGAAWARSDVLVLAGPVPGPAVLAQIRCPVLLVG